MTLAELESRTLSRLGEVSDHGSYYSVGEVRNALNEAQRLFALLTLCLEAKGSIALKANQAWYSPLASMPAFIVPLRVRLAGAAGNKLEPKRLEALDALNPNWQSESGPPRRYACLGPNVFAVHPQPTAGGSSLTVTHARSPVDLTEPGQTPEVPEEYHQDLISWALPRLRAKEGAEEWRKSLPEAERFWRAAQKLAMYVRARNLASRYDQLPPEERFFDGSRLLDLMKRRRAPWPTMLDIPQAAGSQSRQTM